MFVESLSKLLLQTSLFAHKSRQHKNIEHENVQGSPPDFEPADKISEANDNEEVIEGFAGFDNDLLGSFCLVRKAEHQSLRNELSSWFQGRYQAHTADVFPAFAPNDDIDAKTLDHRTPITHDRNGYATLRSWQLKEQILSRLKEERKVAQGTGTRNVSHRLDQLKQLKLRLLTGRCMNYQPDPINFFHP